MKIYKVRHKLKDKFLTNKNGWTDEGDVFVSKDDLDTCIQLSTTAILKSLPLCEIVEYDLHQSKKYSILEFVGDKVKSLAMTFFTAREIIKSMKK